MNIITAEEINKGAETPQEYIKLCEYEFDGKIEELKNYIIKKGIRFVFISGPSASGKTTMTKKLCKKLGSAFSIGLDDYFRLFEHMPKKKSGEMNFESVNSLDLVTLKKDLTALANGEKIYPPTLDFMDMSRGKSARGYSLSENGICIIEGLHALNSKIHGIFNENALKIFISPMTPIATKTGQISIYDIRFIRRIVRDSFFRNAGAEINLKMWPDVRAGEKIYTASYRKNADFLIDTFIPYEMCILRKHIERELKKVPLTPKTKRILNAVGSFTSLPDEYVPETSLLKEFIK